MIIKSSDLRTINLVNTVLADLNINDCTVNVIPISDRPICACCNTPCTVGLHSKSIGNLAFMSIKRYSSKQEAYNDFKDTILRASLNLGSDN
jgi:hypothetical protein